MNSCFCGHVGSKCEIQEFFFLVSNLFLNNLMFVVVFYPLVEICSFSFPGDIRLSCTVGMTEEEEERIKQMTEDEELWNASEEEEEETGKPGAARPCVQSGGGGGQFCL